MPSTSESGLMLCLRVLQWTIFLIRKIPPGSGLRIVLTLNVASEIKYGSLGKTKQQVDFNTSVVSMQSF